MEDSNMNGSTAVEVQQNDVGFMINIQKQNMLTGEVISIATNLPKGSDSEDLRSMIQLVTAAIDWRIPQTQVVDLGQQQAM